MGFIKDKTLGFFVKTKGLVSDRIYGGIGISFMLHRVLPSELRDQYTINRDLAITPSQLETVILYLQKKGCRFASLDELYDILQSGRKPDRKLICITLDDGYRDNLLYGLPVFQKRNIPVTIYVTNCFPNHTALLWWYWLEQKLHTDHQLRIDTASVSRNYQWTSQQQADALFPEIRTVLKSLPKTEISAAMKETFGKDDAAISRECQDISLTWDEIRQLSGEALVTIGAHTMNHLSLRTLTDAELEYEICTSKQELLEKTGKAIEHFAYPYGAIGDAFTREYSVAKKHFKTAVLNRRGNISMGQVAYTECIPRMPMGQNITPGKLDQMLNGITHFSDHGFMKTIHY
ncbi:MAG: polysaccharide deacetylase family protein [Bacteroidetes bacterium]|nr:polysaccharide deacetylase family protein [Bacteroidota bacterium]